MTTVDAAAGDVGGGGADGKACGLRADAGGGDLKNSSATRRQKEVEELQLTDVLVNVV